MTVLVFNPSLLLFGCSCALHGAAVLPVAFAGAVPGGFLETGIVRLGSAGVRRCAGELRGGRTSPIAPLCPLRWAMARWSWRASESAGLFPFDSSGHNNEPKHC